MAAVVTLVFVAECGRKQRACMNIDKGSAVAASLRCQWMCVGVVGFGRISPSEEASSDELCGGQGACLGRETNFQTRAHRRLAVPLTVAVGSWCRCLRRG
jgi:hypothetical protein